MKNIFRSLFLFLLINIGNSLYAETLDNCNIALTGFKSINLEKIELPATIDLEICSDELEDENTTFQIYGLSSQDQWLNQKLNYLIYEQLNYYVSIALANPELPANSLHNPLENYADQKIDLSRLNEMILKFRSFFQEIKKNDHPYTTCSYVMPYTQTKDYITFKQYSTLTPQSAPYGSSFERYITLDLINKRVITLDDLVDPNRHADVIKALWQEYQDEYGYIKQDAFMKTKLPANFYFSDDENALVFVYGQLALGASAMDGIVQLSLDLNKHGKLINPKYLKQKPCTDF